MTAILDPLVPLGSLAQQVPKPTLDRRVLKAFRAQQAQLDLTPDSQAQLVRLVRRGPWDRLDLQAEAPAQPDRKVNLGIREERQDRLARRRLFPDSLAQRDRRAHKATRAIQELLAPQVLVPTLGLLDLKPQPSS